MHKQEQLFKKAKKNVILEYSYINVEISSL